MFVTVPPHLSIRQLPQRPVFLLQGRAPLVQGFTLALAPSPSSTYTRTSTPAPASTSAAESRQSANTYQIRQDTYREP